MQKNGTYVVDRRKKKMVSTIRITITMKIIIIEATVIIIVVAIVIIAKKIKIPNIINHEKSDN